MAEASYESGMIALMERTSAIPWAHATDMWILRFIFGVAATALIVSSQTRKSAQD